MTDNNSAHLLTNKIYSSIRGGLVRTCGLNNNSIFLQCSFKFVCGPIPHCPWNPHPDSLCGVVDPPLARRSETRARHDQSAAGDFYPSANSVATRALHLTSSLRPSASTLSPAGSADDSHQEFFWCAAAPNLPDCWVECPCQAGAR